MKSRIPRSTTAPGIFLVDREGHYVDAKPVAAEMLGYSLEELLTLSIKDVIEPDDH
jgi:PAS domain S-box-containing protein